MATTVVFPSLDVSGTGSISTLISTAGTFAGSLTASSLTVTGTATFSGTAVFVGTAQFLATVTFSASVRFLTALDVSGTLSCNNLNVLGNLGFTNTVSFAGQVLMNRGTGFYTPNSYLLGTATGVSTTQFKIAFSNTSNAFTQFQLTAAGKGGPTTTNLILYLYTDGGTTPFMTYALAANATATASEAIAVIDIVQDIGSSGLVVVVPRFQHFKGITTQIAQTRSATFTASCINCIGVSGGAGATTTTLSSALIMLTGFITAR